MADGHEWARVGDLPEEVTDWMDALDVRAKSDVHLCKKCGQIGLSHVGEPMADNEVTSYYVKPCDEAMVEGVMAS